MGAPTEGTEMPGTGSELITRRAMLRRTGSAAAMFAGSSWLLAACGSSSSTTSKLTSKVGSLDEPIASPEKPLILPISSANKPIASGLAPEKGPLVLYDWAYYLSPAVIKSFEKKYGVQVQMTNFSSIDEAINKISSGAIAPDAWVPDANHLAELVAAKIIQPLNHSYIPNLDQIIPAAADPWYDRGARYTSPNYINLFGIAWRNDQLKINPAAMSNPWETFWKVPSSAAIGLVNAGPEDALQMAMLRNGKPNMNTFSQQDVTAAQAAIAELKHMKWQYNAFQPLGAGTQQIAYAFNGDMMLVPENLSKGAKLSDVSFFFPEHGNGPILNDMWVIPRTSKHPVLAHLFLNHFLEQQSAIDNFRDVGYQTMRKDLTLDVLKKAKVAPEHAIDMVYATPADQQNGLPSPVLNAHQLQWTETAFTALGG